MPTMQRASREIRITKSSGQVIVFGYDGMQNRAMKAVATGTDTVFTFYVRDAQGNVMGVYNRTTSGTPTITWAEQYIYGSGRLGSFNPGIAWTAASTYAGPHYADTRRLRQGQRRYELTNHLGNVLATIGDRKIPNDGAVVDKIAEYYTAALISAQDYYPFGMEMPGRTFVLSTGQGSRYGFNGKEKDPSEFGALTHYDYGFRIYNPALGRFLSVDPLRGEYPWYTPYQFAGNMPVGAIDLDGKEGIWGAFAGALGEVAGQMIQNKSWDISMVNKTQVLIAAGQGFISPSGSAKVAKTIISYSLEYAKAAVDPKNKTWSDVAREGTQNIIGGLVGEGATYTAGSVVKAGAKKIETIGGTDALARAQTEARRTANAANEGRPRLAQTDRATAAARTLATAESVHKVAPTVAKATVWAESYAGKKAIDIGDATLENVIQAKVNDNVLSDKAAEERDESTPGVLPGSDKILEKTADYIIMYSEMHNRNIRLNYDEAIDKYIHSTSNENKPPENEKK
jgi:RHS repeat-associated protein